MAIHAIRGNTYERGKYFWAITSNSTAFFFVPAQAIPHYGYWETPAFGKAVEDTAGLSEVGKSFSIYWEYRKQSLLKLSNLCSGEPIKSTGRETGNGSMTKAWFAGSKMDVKMQQPWKTFCGSIGIPVSPVSFKTSGGNLPWRQIFELHQIWTIGYSGQKLPWSPTRIYIR